jgi:hypothetical protein
VTAASADEARRRAEEAKVREIAVHRHAIVVQEEAVRRLDLLGRPDLADAARARAGRARGMLEMALEEQETAKIRYELHGEGRPSRR